MRIWIRRISGAALGLAMLASGLPGLAATPEATPAYPVTIDLADFVETIDNPWFPLTPGTTWIYEGESDGELERNEVTVTHETKTILGVTCVVVRDTVLIDGEVVEDTLDWYAQDTEGNVWYFGEESKDYEDGELVSTEGSWEAGVDGAQPGIIMLAEPAVGDRYQQEYYEGEAEDKGEVVATGETVTVPYGTFEDVLVTEDINPFEPGKVEQKSYAPGIGMILAEYVQGGDERIELIEVRTGIPLATPES
jgi:hypothetical protein